MGDRCSLNITVRACDLDAVQDENYGFGEAGEGEDNEDGTRTLRYDEVNYGGEETRDALSAKGLVYVGDHYAGGDYSAQSFCSLGQEDFQWEMSDGRLVAGVSDTGDLEEPGGVRRFIWDRAVAWLILKDPVVSAQWSMWDAAKVSIDKRLEQLGLPMVEDDD